MPRKRIPKYELLWRDAKVRQRIPDDCRCRLGKTVPAFLGFAGPPRLDAGEDLLRLDPPIFQFSQKDSLRSHGNSAEMTAAIANGLTDHREFCFAQSFSQIHASP